MATSTGKDPSQDEEFLSQLYKGGELLAAGKVAALSWSSACRVYRQTSLPFK